MKVNNTSYVIGYLRGVGCESGVGHFPSSSSPSLGYFIRVIFARKSGGVEGRRHLKGRRMRMREWKAIATKGEVVVVGELGQPKCEDFPPRLFAFSFVPQLKGSLL